MPIKEDEKLKAKIESLFRQNGKDKKATLLSPGVPAPDFSLMASSGETETLSKYQGRPVVLVFYPKDESPVCSNQLALYNDALHLFDEYGAQILGISVDDIASHQAFVRSLNLRFPLLSDDDPVGAVAGLYGVFDEGDGRSKRALFVIDPEGIIHWSYLSPGKINPGAHGILQALESIKRRATSKT